MKIRLLAGDDVLLYRDLRLEALQTSPAAFSEGVDEHLAHPLEKLRNRLDHPGLPGSGSFVLGALDAGRLVGIVGFLGITRKKTAHRGDIWGLYVAADRRGEGIGRRLMEAAIRRARKNEGLKQIHLSVMAENVAARRLYETLGFQTWGTEPRSLRLDGRYLDRDYMILIFDEAE